MRTHLDIKHTGTINGDGRVRMTFDENSIAHLMSVLTDLYSDPVTAVIREYSTNALDSHRAAGISDPIEVTLPNALSSEFVVKDHGVGMTVDEVLNNFSKYGWSSKRDTDDEVGMLGLGCKSGLTYSSQFTFIAVKSGVRAVVLVTREADGAGAVQVVDTSATDEPDGVEVQIPVGNWERFVRKAQRFYRFWEPGTVLVDGEEPEKLGGQPTDLWLDPDILLTTADIGSDFIVMGNVPYPVDQGMVGPIAGASQRGPQLWTVARVPIGAINFTPSREALHYTKRTKETVADLRDFVADSYRRMAQDDIDAAATSTEAVRRALRWRRITRGGAHPRYTYQGIEIPFTVHAPEYTLQWSSYDHGPATRTTSWRIEDLVDTEDSLGRSYHQKKLIVVGYKPISLSRIVKDKIRFYVDQHKLGGPHGNSVVAIVTSERFGTPWLEDLTFVDYETQIKPITLPSLPGYPSTQVEKGKYRILGRKGSVIQTNDLPTDKTVVWLPAGDKSYKRDELWRAFTDELAFVLVPKSKEATFKKAHPSILGFDDWLRAEIATEVAGLTTAQIVQWSDHGYISNSKLENFVGRYSRNENLTSQFVDPELRAVLKVVKDTSSVNNNRYGLLLTWCGNRNIENVPGIPQSDFKDKLTAVMKKYPLLQEADSYFYNKEFPLGLGDFVAYANALYYNTLSMPYCYDH